jgi:hypothetical protein
MAKVIGGQRVKSYLQDLSRKLGSRKSLKVGFFGGVEPNGASLPLVASVAEYGGGNSPPRPFMRPTIASKKQEWALYLARHLKQADYNVETVYKQLGPKMAADIQDGIRHNAGPPDAPATVKEKGSAQVLINTGTMLDSVTWKIE